MESLNLNALAGSLPTANLANAEKELLNNFRAAAMSITNLYRSSRSTSKRAYNSGYAAACADLLQMIQQGVSDSETPPTIGRVMDWVEARLEAVRAREEEEEDEEDEESAGKKDKVAKLKASAGTTTTLPRANSAPAVPQQPPREQPAPSKLSQAINTAPTAPASTPPSPSPPAHTTTTTTTTTTARPIPSPAPPACTPVPAPAPARTPKPARAFASPLQAKENPLSSTMTMMPSAIHHPFPISPESPFTFAAFRPSLPSSPAPTDPGAGPGLTIPLPLTVSASGGVKRRHAAMMVLADDAGSVPAATAALPSAGAGTGIGTGSGSSRRRTRSTRGAHQNQHQHQHAQDAMDIEEDGRERKRVARR